VCSDATQDSPHQKYSGWIPTANGRLSFRHIGHADHPRRASYANVVDQHDQRFIASLQSRSLSDALFEPIVSRLFKTPGEFDFILTGSSAGPTSASNSTLVGNISIFIDPESHCGNATMPVAEKLDQLRTEPRFQTRLKVKFVELEQLVLGNADIHVSFTLNRDGVVRFDTPDFKDRELHERSLEEAALRGIDFEKWVADQAYFFLRDLSHVHQHHDSATDTILILQETGEDDVGWRDKILYSLQFIVVAQRRLKDKQALARAKGLVAYSHAFRSVTHNALPDARLVSFSDDALLMSIDASLEELTLVRTTEQDWHRTKMSLVLWAVAAAIAVLAIFVQPRLALDEALLRPLLHMSSVWAAENFFNVMVFIGTVATVVFFWKGNPVGYGTRNATMVAQLAKDVLTIGAFRPWIGWALLTVGLGMMGTVGYAYLKPLLQAVAWPD
jgi:hypothetical protein